MESLPLQQRVTESLGSTVSVSSNRSGAGAVYGFLVLQTPLTSDEATTAAAWQRVQDTLAFAATHRSLFEPNSKVEVIVGFPESVAATKRRIFRVGGPLADISTLLALDPVRRDGDVYVVAYDHWHSSVERPQSGSQ